MLSALPDANRDKVGQPGAITCGMASARCLNHFFGGNLTPLDQETSLKRQCPDEFPLCAAVAFAKRMDGINFSEIERGRRTKLFSSSPRSQFSLDKSCNRLLNAGSTNGHAAKG